jgi:DNA-binding NarL/FixJ family response regulator
LITSQHEQAPILDFGAGPRGYTRRAPYWPHSSSGAGTVGVLARDASPITARDTIRAAIAGFSLLPVDILRSFAKGFAHEETTRPLSDDEIGWLRQLADGVTVARLAEHVGYSERMMFRLLSDLYGRLGVDNRTKALMRARDEGWLGNGPP